MSARSLATTLTISVIALTPSLALADDESFVGPPPQLAPQQGEQTPLELRPQRPLETAPAQSGSSAWMKIGLCGLVAAGAFLLYRRKRGVPVAAGPSLRVAARTAIGVRSELIVVDVDGQRLLLGVTPSSVRTLSILTGEPASATASGEVDEPVTPAPGTLGTHFERLLARAREDDGVATLRETAPPRRRAPSTPSRSFDRPTLPSPIEDQTPAQRALEGQVVSLARIKHRAKR